MLAFFRTAAAVVLVLLVRVGPAHAQPSGDAATAQALFDDAKLLMDRGEYAVACAKLEESQRLDPGPGTLFHLASCYERSGRTASAWATYLEVAGAAAAAGRSAHEAVAREHAKALEPRLSRLKLVVSPNASADTVIERDGVELGRSAWSASVPVDPGAHVVRASSPSALPWETRIEVVEEGRTVVVNIPALAPRDEAAPVRALTPTKPPTKANLQRPIALATGAAGVVALGVGTFLGLRAISLDDQSAPHCNGNTCDARGVTLRDEAFSTGTTSTVFFIAGGVALAAGLFFWFTAERTPSPLRSSR